LIQNVSEMDVQIRQLYDIEISWDFIKLKSADLMLEKISPDLLLKLEPVLEEA